MKIYIAETNLNNAGWNKDCSLLSHNLKDALRTYLDDIVDDDLKAVGAKRIDDGHIENEASFTYLDIYDESVQLDIRVRERTAADIADK